MRIRSVAFDLDDTLIPNSYKYNLAIWKCGLIITEALLHRCPYATELMKLQYETDTRLVKEAGFRADRFPTSWTDTYRGLCDRLGVAPDADVARRLYATAEEFRAGPFLPMPGVPEMLGSLRDEGRELHLITAGDDALQRQKIAESGLAPFFRGIRVVEMHKQPVLAELFGSDPSSAAMVGDSLKSDIKPAVALGVVAVHVSSLTWPFVNADVDPASYHPLESILDLPDLLRRLDSAR